MKSNQTVRHHLINKLSTKIKSKVAFVKCEKCGRYFKMDEIQCHHSVIPICEIIKSYKEGTLKRKDAKELAETRENIILVCENCHKILHKNESLTNKN